MKTNQISHAPSHEIRV